MNRPTALVLSAGGLALSLFATTAVAQPADAPPPPPPPRDGGGPGGPQGGGRSVVDRLLALDKNKDGKLTKDEVTDPRLQRLFERADKDGDGTVTKDELTALAATMESDRGGPGGDGGPGGPGGPGGRGGPRGGGGPGGMGGPPQPGVVLPPMLQDRLNLTPEQREKLQALQADVDRRLADILTAEQKQQLQEMRNRGPGRGPGGGSGEGPGGRGRGRPGGGPGGDAPPPPPER